ncbi:hypothetical protein CGCTS75_v013187 [Colletotrichum tropicale]|nr:hypothetical protein CGCTS75_v013187 [Colletotrichum tropicale]
MWWTWPAWRQPGRGLRRLVSRMAGLPDELVLPIPGRPLLCMC